MRKYTFIFIMLTTLIYQVSCSPENDKDKKYKLSFLLDGEKKEYSTWEDDGFWEYNSTTRTCVWDKDSESVDMDVSKTAAAGTTYVVGTDAHFDFELDLNGSYYYANNGFTITIAETSSTDGGMISGTFSGTVSDLSVTKTITNGVFEAEYQPD